MMPPGIQTKQLAVEHVRQHRQGIPLAHWPVSERPSDAAAGQPGSNLRTRGDEQIVVVIEEAEAERLPIDHRDQCHEDAGHGPGWNLAVARSAA